jgi:hypothetical protein
MASPRPRHAGGGRSALRRTVVLERGALGPEVVVVQQRLAAIGLYGGPIDGVFGGGTEAAVRMFQRQSHLVMDGIVGPRTWRTLMPGRTIAPPAITRRSLARRCLALTGSFETGLPPPECFSALSGDFDDQGLSLGVCQWNLGQGTLQPLLARMVAEHPGIVETIFDDRTPELRALLAAPRAEQLAWARSLQDARHRVCEPWRGYLKTLARHEEFQRLQERAAGRLLGLSRRLCATYRVRSQRALALMFDIVVQNGGIGVVVAARIARDLARLGDPAEMARLRVVALRRAEAANPRWTDDVRARKLTIAEGRGVVHGRRYDLARDYGITLSPFAGRRDRTAAG